jgi:hypothetical protein
MGDEIRIGDWVRLTKPHRGGDFKLYRQGILGDIIAGCCGPIGVVRFPRYRGPNGQCIAVDIPMRMLRPMRRK